MQLGYTVLNLTLLWVNTWATFKTLDRRKPANQGTRSSRLQQRSKREMKTCLSVWVVWVSWRMLERMVDATVGLVIPFFHEMKCLFLLLLIITRPWGTEPLVMNVLRPAIKPYTGIIDMTLHWLELGGDFIFLILSLPYHMVISRWNSWWNSEPEDDKPRLEVPVAPEESSGASTATHSPAVVEPSPFATLVAKPEVTTDIPDTVQAAIEAHRQEQQQQAEEEARMKEIRERSARDRLVHLRAVTKPPLPLPPKRNAGISQTTSAATKSAASSSSSDLPASALNLPINRKPSRDTLSGRPPAPWVLPVKRTNIASDSASEEPRPSIYPMAALAMPMPVRAHPKPTRPAVHTNDNANISRPANPAPQVPSVVIPLTSQTLPRVPRVRPTRSSPPPGLGSRTVGARSTDTLHTASSTATLPVNEFGVGGHRRESADDETVSGESGSGTLTNTGTGGEAGGQTWEDFMASLERPNQAAITHPRGTSGPQPNGSTPHDTVESILATRENQEKMKRIANMKKEVDEKLQRITERTGKATTTTAKPVVVTLKSTRGKAAAATATAETGESEKMEIDETHYAGQKRPRKSPGHLVAKVTLDTSSSSGEGGEDKPSPKRKKIELDDEAMDDATIASSSVKDVKPSRPTRTTTIKAKEKATAPPAVSRTGTVRSTRSTAQRSADVASVPAIATRTRGRGAG